MVQRLLPALLLTVFLSACQESVNYSKDDRYPWQVTLMSDGSIRVFGIHLGVTPASEARDALGKAPKLALFENPDGRLSLELFYKEFTRAGLSGKLILTIGDSYDVLLSLKKQSHKHEKLESGVLQYYLDKPALAIIDKLPVVAMTYMPYAGLPEDTIRARFGEPAEKVRSHEKAQHWLYPDRGLDLVINEEGKEVLQYVSPAEFEKLASPLRIKHQP